MLFKRDTKVPCGFRLNSQRWYLVLVVPLWFMPVSCFATETYFGHEHANYEATVISNLGKDVLSINFLWPKHVSERYGWD